MSDKQVTHAKKWTNEEVAIVKTMSSDTVAKIAAKLERSTISVADRIYRIAKGVGNVAASKPKAAKPAAAKKAAQPKKATARKAVEKKNKKVAVMTPAGVVIKESSSKESKSESKESTTAATTAARSLPTDPPVSA